MHKMFIEYVIPQHHRAAYLTYITHKQKQWSQLEVLESMEQPGLFLELWHIPSDEVASIVVSQDIQLGQWIEGFPETCKCWTFQGI